MPAARDPRNALGDHEHSGAEATIKMRILGRSGPTRDIVVPTLRVVAGKDMLRFVTFAPGEVVVIGREDTAGLILSDPSVSRRHAKIICAADGALTVHDLTSTNGTAVNGCAVSSAPLRPNDHLEIGAVSLRLEVLSIEEIGHLATVVARLESASRDPLTGLLTRAWLEDELPGLLRRTEDEAVPISVAFVDIDKFKQVNDVFGHAVGDDALVGVARLMMLSVRDGDPCVRFGGEEIVVFLEGADTEHASEVAERIRASIETHVWSHTAPDLAITASVGVATRRPGEGWRAWIARADDALRAAKNLGRNRVVTAAE